MKTLLKLLIVCSLFSITFAQVNYYVDGAQGTDNPLPGNGLSTGASAWKTIEYAVDNVSDPTTATIIINVADSTYTLSNNQIDIARNFKDLTILGSSTSGTIVQATNSLGTSKSRVFYISSGNTVALKNMSIRYGRPTIFNINNNGCGINNEGTLTLDYCDIYENQFIQTNLGGYGIGVGNVNGKLTVSNSTIRDNAITVTNLGTYYGGGIGCLNGEVEILNSTISNNLANGGGGISIISSTATGCSLKITNSTIALNNAYALSGPDPTGDYGGIRISVFSNGSSIATDINSCTIFNNSANRAFGGIGLASDNGPSAIIFRIKNSIVGGNTSGDIGGKTLVPQITVTSLGYNLIQNFNSTALQVDSSSQAGSNIYNKSPQCSTLALYNSTNGTKTCFIPSTSPAIDKIPSGSPNGAPSLDQRGAGRLGNYDIGAYEYWGINGELPVELTSFTSSLKNNKVFLNWETANEVNNYGFEVERQVGSLQSSVSNSNIKDWEKIGFVNGSGTSNSPKEYSYVDENLFGGSNFQYRLKQLDLDGHYEYSDVVEINMIPGEYSLSQNYPNPFNPSTKIEYSVPEKSNVSINIYGLLGNEVLELFSGEKEPGIYKVEFSAKGGSASGGNAYNLPSGVYFYRMQAGKFVQTKKMILLK